MLTATIGYGDICSVLPSSTTFVFHLCCCGSIVAFINLRQRLRCSFARQTKDVVMVTMLVSMTGVYLCYGACAISAAPRAMQLFPQLVRAGAVFVGAHVRAFNAVLDIPNQQSHAQAQTQQAERGGHREQSTGVAIADERLATLEQRLQALLDSSDRDAGQVGRILEEMDQVRLQASE